MSKTTNAASETPVEPLAVDPEATAGLQQMIPYVGKLGIEVIAATREEVRGRLRWSAELCTADGGLNGGAIMSIADNLGGVCAFLNLPEGATGTTTIESKSNFMRAVRSGHVDSLSRPLHVGRSVIVVVTDVVDADGRMVAHVTQSQIVLRP